MNEFTRKETSVDSLGIGRKEILRRKLEGLKDSPWMEQINKWISDFFDPVENKMEFPILDISIKTFLMDTTIFIKTNSGWWIWTDDGEWKPLNETTEKRGWKKEILPTLE